MVKGQRSMMYWWGRWRGWRDCDDDDDDDVVVVDDDLSRSMDDR